MYAGCPITWFSRLQGEITLSTTESEYVALSTATRECLPMRELFVELGKYVKIGSITPNIHCTLFEDNSSCEQLAKSPKMNSRTKHIAIKYHHFRQAVVDGILHITRVPTEDQLADIFTKPVPRPILRHFRKEIMGWVSFNSWLRYRKIKCRNTLRPHDNSRYFTIQHSLQRECKVTTYSRESSLAKEWYLLLPLDHWNDTDSYYINKLNTHFTVTQQVCISAEN